MSLFEKVFSIFVFVLFAGIIILFFWFESLNKNVKVLQAGTPPDEELIQIETKSGLVELTTVQNELESLQASFSALLKRVDTIENSADTSGFASTVSEPSFQKQIVHIGSSSTKELEWTNSGVVVTLNSNDYPTDVMAQFEVGISIVGGQGWARLVNKSTGAILNITEVYADSSETTWRSSQKFKLHNGSNIYELQVRSTSGEVANFSSARIILTK